MCKTSANNPMGADDVNNVHNMYMTSVCLEYHALYVVGK